MLSSLKSLVRVAGMVGLLSLPAGLVTTSSAAQTAAPAHVRGDLAGDWQGTIADEKPLRIILQITKTAKGLTGKMYSIDMGSQGFSTSSMTLEGSNFVFTVDLIGGNYHGTLSADGAAIVGVWKQVPTPQPLTFVRATKETAWEIPAPPPPIKLMAADADPAFEVATIKPNNTGATSMQGLNVNGRNFSTRASSLVDLISFAYEVQSKQVVGAPAWMSEDRFDIAAVPDVEGAPNPTQLRVMIKKLMADRFKLTFHQEQREMPAFVMTKVSVGSTLKPTEMVGPLPGLGLRPVPSGLMLMMRNGTIGEFTGFLQTLVLDRPVVDETKLTGKFDLSVTFTPDDSLFNGHAPPLPAKTEEVAPAPSLFEAFQQQLGLKVEAKRTPVQVMAIDHVEKYSAN